MSNLKEAVSRKHFQMVADTLKAVKDEGKRKELACHHADLFAKANPRFDRSRFMSAAGVNEEVEQTPSIYEAVVDDPVWEVGTKDKQNALLCKHNGEQVAIVTGPTSVHPYVAHIGSMVVHYPWSDLQKVKEHVEGLMREELEDLETEAIVESITDLLEAEEIDEAALTEGYGVKTSEGTTKHDNLADAVQAAMRRTTMHERAQVIHLESGKKIEWDGRLKANHKEDVAITEDQRVAFKAFMRDKLDEAKKMSKVEAEKHAVTMMVAHGGKRDKGVQSRIAAASKMQADSSLAMAKDALANVKKYKSEAYHQGPAVPGSFVAPNSEFDSNPGYTVGQYQINGRLVKIIRMGDLYAPVKVVIDHEEWKDAQGEGMRFVNKTAALAAFNDMQRGEGGHQERHETPAEGHDDHAEERTGTLE